MEQPTIHCIDRGPNRLGHHNTTLTAPRQSQLEFIQRLLANPKLAAFVQSQGSQGQQGVEMVEKRLCQRGIHRIHALQNLRPQLLVGDAAVQYQATASYFTGGRMSG